MKVLLGLFLVVVSGCSHLHSKNSVEIVTLGNTDGEKQTKNKLEDLLSRYDLSKYIFTRKINIGERKIPHSHPILTLHTRYKNDSDRLLSLFLHEQIHWLEDSKGKEFKAAMQEFEKLYPNPPSKFPEAANNRESTYRHFVVNYLEIRALREFLGEQRANKRFKSPNVYTWIYPKILSDEERVKRVVEKHNLLFISTK